MIGPDWVSWPDDQVHCAGRLPPDSGTSRTCRGSWMPQPDLSQTAPVCAPRKTTSIQAGSMRQVPNESPHASSLSVTPRAFAFLTWGRDSPRPSGFSKLPHFSSHMLRSEVFLDYTGLGFLLKSRTTFFFFFHSAHNLWFLIVKKNFFFL